MQMKVASATTMLSAAVVWASCVLGVGCIGSSGNGGSSSSRPASSGGTTTAPTTRRASDAKRKYPLDSLPVGTVTIDAQGNITANSYDAGAILWTPSSYFNGATFPASSLQEDASGNFFTIQEQDGSVSTVFGTQNGLWAVDNDNGTILGLPKASTKSFNPASAGTYNAIYYEKPDAQMVNNVEVGTPLTGKATVTVTAAGAVTITDSQNNPMASGTLAAVADTPYIYDGTPNELADPCYGMYTFQTITSSLHQDVFVTFQGNAVIFSSFQTAVPVQNNGTYTYFQGVGLK